MRAKKRSFLNMSDIFREVDEAMQQEKLLKIWKEYSSTIIMAIVVLLVSSAGASYYYKVKADKNAKETAKLVQALQADKPIEALIAATGDTKASHKAIGLMSAANLQLQEGKKAEASALYQQVFEDKKSPRNIRELARVFYTQNADTPSLDILEPILVNKKSPWLWQAKIEAAVITAHQDKDYNKALSYLEAIEKEEFIPFSLKQRGKALQHVYTLKAAQENTDQSSAE